MKTYAEIQQAVQGLSHEWRQQLAIWIGMLNDDELAVAEAAVPYGIEPVRQMSEEEYLALLESGTIKYEYVDGYVYAMSGPTVAHNTITLNMGAALHTHVRGGPCRAFMADMNVRIREVSSRCFYFPDIVVTCEPITAQQHEIKQPKLIVEVLSPSTQRTDQVEKAQNYRLIQALEEYAIVDQHRPRITVHRRSENWRPQMVAGADNSLRLYSIDLTLSLAQIYENAL